jgi:hypothetical protein
MKSQKLFTAIGGIDDRFISEQAEKMPIAQQGNSYTPKRVPRLLFRRLASAACVACMLCSLLTGIVFAEDIKAFFATMLSSENGTIPISEIGTVSIKDTAIKTDNQSLIPMSMIEAENMLGVDILNTKRATSYMVGYSTYQTGNRIGRVDLWYADFIDYSDENRLIDEAVANSQNHDEYQKLMRERKGISMSIAFLTPFADESLIDPFRTGIDATGGKNVDSSYALKNLGVDAVFYTNDWSDTRLTAAFVYNNMLYTFIGNNISVDEMFDILQSLK